MGRLGRLFLVAALAVVTIAVAAEPAASSYPGANGHIVFSNGTNELWSVRSDGSDLHVLTTVPSPAGVRSFVSFPSFSADGSKIAVMLNEFNRPTPCDPKALNADSGVCRVIVLMNADGSNQHSVFASEDIASLDLALSPDGSQIAFTMVTGSASEQLFVIAADGKPLRLLTRQTRNNPATDTAPSWSPDGRTIAFQSTRDEALTGHSWSLFSVSLRTGAISRIAPASANNDLEPNWAPDGSKLVFLRTFAFPDSRIYTVNRDGSGEQEILHDGSAPELPASSPDGTQILYLSQGQLRLVNADGSDPHAITSGGSFGFSWEPVPPEKAPTSS
jgi:Tol biopolymer transport system component